MGKNELKANRDTRWMCQISKAPSLGSPKQMNSASHVLVDNVVILFESK